MILVENSSFGSTSNIGSNSVSNVSLSSAISFTVVDSFSPTSFSFSSGSSSPSSSSSPSPLLPSLSTPSKSTILSPSPSPSFSTSSSASSSSSSVSSLSLSSLDLNTNHYHQHSRFYHSHQQHQQLLPQPNNNSNFFQSTTLSENFRSTESFIDFDELDQLLASTGGEQEVIGNSTKLSDIDPQVSTAVDHTSSQQYYCDQYCLSDLDEDVGVEVEPSLNLFELDFSDSASQTAYDLEEEEEDELNESFENIYNQSVCPTSMSNYSSASSSVSSLLEDVCINIKNRSDCSAPTSTTVSATPSTRIAARHNLQNQYPRISPGVVLKPVTTAMSTAATRSAYVFGAGFDAVSNYGSGASSASSCSSSTPSTPSSTVIGVPSCHQQLVSCNVSSPSTTLPSFNEIYSPRYGGGGSNSSANNIVVNDDSGQSYFDYNTTNTTPNTTSSEYFKFEDYISESESLSESEHHEQPHRQRSSTSTPSTGSLMFTASEHEHQECKMSVGSLAKLANNPCMLSSAMIPLKEEPIDSFVSSDEQTSSMETIVLASKVGKKSTTTGGMYAEFRHNKTSTITGSSNIHHQTSSLTSSPNKRKLSQTEEEEMRVDEEANKSENQKEENELFGYCSLFTAESPKPMRCHLNSLPLDTYETIYDLGQAPVQQTNSSHHSQRQRPQSTGFDIDQSPSVQSSNSGCDLMDTTITTTTASATITSTQASSSSLLLDRSDLAGSHHHVPHKSSHTNVRHTINESSVANHHRVHGTNKSRTQRHKNNQMQSCAVCGDIAACQHYGVLTCEGCKGFFKRTVQKGSKYTCLGNKDCTVDKRRRNRCQFCRFQKCLAVGMVKEVVRTDNLKGRRGRLPSKPKSPQELPVSPPMSTIAALVKAHEETSADKANLDFSQFNESIIDNNKMNIKVAQYIDRQVLSLLSSSLDTLLTFMEKIPGFNELNESDRRLLFQNSCLELFALRMAYRITPGTNFIVLCNNIVLHRNQFASTFAEWLPMIEELSGQLHSMRIDVNAFACLCALTVITGRHGVQDMNKIDQLETKIINSLKDHTVYNNEAQKKVNYFSRILSKLPELRTIGEIGHRITLSKMQQLSTEHITPEIVQLERKITPTNSISSSTTITSSLTKTTQSALLASSSSQSSSTAAITTTNNSTTIGNSLNNVPNTTNSTIVTPVANNGQNNIMVNCLDLPSISSFFKGWPQVK